MDIVADLLLDLLRVAKSAAIKGPLIGSDIERSKLMKLASSDTHLVMELRSRADIRITMPEFSGNLTVPLFLPSEESFKEVKKTFRPNKLLRVMQHSSRATKIIINDDKKSVEVEPASLTAFFHNPVEVPTGTQEGEELNLSGAQFEEVLSFVHTAVSKEGEHPWIQGIAFDRGQVYATDGNRLHSQGGIPILAPKRKLVPSSVIEALMALRRISAVESVHLRAIRSKKQDYLVITAQAEHRIAKKMIFEAVVYADVDPPDLEEVKKMLWPTEHQAQFLVYAPELLRAIQDLSIFIKEAKLEHKAVDLIFGTTDETQNGMVRGYLRYGTSKDYDKTQRTEVAVGLEGLCGQLEVWASRVLIEELGVTYNITFLKEALEGFSGWVRFFYFDAGYVAGDAVIIDAPSDGSLRSALVMPLSNGWPNANKRARPIFNKQEDNTQTQ